MNTFHHSEKRKSCDSTETEESAKTKNLSCPNCTRAYKSYCALYTHFKKKHEPIHPEILLHLLGKKRGRPLIHLDQKNTYPNTEFPELTIPNGITANPLKSLKKESKSLYQFQYSQHHPLYYFLENALNGNQEGEQTCDKVLAEYLAFIAGKVGKTFFKVIVRFVMLFRDCINMDYTGKSATNSVRYMPSKFNEFIAFYLKDVVIIKVATPLALHFSDWLFKRSYTCIKLALREI